MKLLPSVSRLLTLTCRPSSLLVCETDGFLLRGAVLARSGNEVAVLHTAESRLPGMVEAVAELMERLRSSGWRGGKAVLLTPGVLPALLELPVDPKKPRPPEQMADLVRWEMEPLLMQHTTLWSVGRILVGLGHLTEDQARAVIDAQQGRGKPGAAKTDFEVYSFKRFGDLAVELGFIDRKQLDEALVRQEWMKTEGEEVACGWTPQEAHTHDDSGSHRWLACAVSKALLQRWVEVFSRHGVKLRSLYPLAGCAAATLGSAETARLLLESHGGVATATTVAGGSVTGFHMQPESLWMLLESHAGLVTATNLQGAAISGFNLHQSALSGPLEACLEAYHALTPPEPDILWLAAVKEESIDLPGQLKQVLGCEVRLLPHIAAGENGDVTTPGMLGAARHSLGLAGAHLCCDIPTEGPRKPAWQRIEIRAAAAALLLAVAVGATEVALQVRMGLAAEHKARADKEAATLDASVNLIKEEIESIKKQQESLQAKRQEVASARARVRFFSEELPQRSVFMQALLIALEQSVSEEVVIDRIEEIPVAASARPGQPTLLPVTMPGIIAAPQGGFRLTAWTLNETAAQQFVQSIKSAMQPWGMDVLDISVIAQAGRLGLPGNAVSLRIVKPLPVTAAKATPPGSAL